MLKNIGFFVIAVMCALSGCGRALPPVRPLSSAVPVTTPTSSPSSSAIQEPTPAIEEPLPGRVTSTVVVPQTFSLGGNGSTVTLRVGQVAHDKNNNPKEWLFDRTLTLDSISPSGANVTFRIATACSPLSTNCPADRKFIEEETKHLTFDGSYAVAYGTVRLTLLSLAPNSVTIHMITPSGSIDKKSLIQPSSTIALSGSAIGADSVLVTLSDGLATALSFETSTVAQVTHKRWSVVFKNIYPGKYTVRVSGIWLEPGSHADAPKGSIIYSGTLTIVK